MESKRKLKGGAEKLREKKKKQLALEAAKCAKLTSLFKIGSGGPSVEKHGSKGSEDTVTASCSEAVPSATQQGTEEGSAAREPSTSQEASEGNHPLPMERKRKFKGGAEKICGKKRLLASEAEKCVKLTSLFKVGSASGPSEAQQASRGSEDVITEISSEEEPSATQASEEGKEERIESTSVQWPSESREVTESLEAEATNQGTEAGNKLSETRSDNQQAEEVVDIFVRPKEMERASFFNRHPVQPLEDTSLPFKPKQVFEKRNGTCRNWISYKKSSGALYCTVCLAYSKSNESNAFTEGMSTWSHVYQRISEHENSKHHISCADAHMQSAKKKDTGELLFSSRQKRRDKIENNRQVMKRVIEVIRLIAKRGLSFGSKDEAEAAYALDDPLFDHGNFLEMLILVSKYDLLLKTHIDQVVKKSQAAHSAGSKEHGSLVTFISKTMAENIIQVLALLIKKTVADEVRESGMFSVQLDTTPDIYMKDQCSIIIRYVDKLKGIQERLLAVVNCKDPTGRGFLELLQGVLTENALDITRCIGNATDGAANMQGIYNGFFTWLNNESPGQVHVLCYSHILNVVISDATQSPIAAASLFSLLNGIAVFFRDSYKRMAVWDRVRGQSSAGQQQLQTIGETRWAKDAALTKIFGSFQDGKNSMYVDVIISLHTIEESENISSDLRAEARLYRDALLSYETIMTGFIYLRIFQFTSPLSKYLQTVGMDLLKAHQLVLGTLEQLEKIQRDIEGVESRVADFIDWATEELAEQIPSPNIVIQESFPEKRIWKRKQMPGETASEEPIANAFKDFEVDVHNRILDTTIEILKTRFAKNEALYRDLACLSPVQFGEMKTSLPHTDTLLKLSEALVKFDKEVTKEKLQLELMNLAANWDRLKTSLPEEYTLRKEEEKVDDTDMTVTENYEEEYNEEQSVCKRCQNCAVCVYHTLEKYNLCTDAYKNIGLAYKYLLTLSTTQVACERGFSTLKFIKNRLRSTPSAEHLESFLLMAVEKDILQRLDPDAIINKVSDTSTLLRQELYLEQ